jgi:LacI family transcriptional regulator
MQDVARHARVALKTVSRVVNGEPGVRPEMAERADRVHRGLAAHLHRDATPPGIP